MRKTAIFLAKINDDGLQNPVQVNQDLIGKNGTAWQALASSHVQRGRLQQQNILNFMRGPTAHSITGIIAAVHYRLFAFCLMWQCLEI